MENYANHTAFGSLFFAKVAEEIAAVLTPTGVEQLATESVRTEKCLVDGRLVIRRQGVSHDVMGVRCE